MAARKTRKPRAPAPDREQPDIQQIFRLHLEASQRRNELIEEVRQLRAAGKISEAKQLMRQANQIQECLAALEDEVRPASPHAE